MRRIALAFLLFAPLTACSSGNQEVPPEGDAGDDGSLDVTADAAETGSDDAMDASDGDALDASETGDTSVDTAPPASETCPATFGACAPAAGTNKYVRLKGTIVTPSAVHCDGEVLFASDTGKIACVGDDCSADPNAAAAQVVCSEGVVYPGLIDPHQHADYNHLPVFEHPSKYENRNHWRQHEPLYDDFKIPHKPFGSTNRDNQILSELYAEMRIVFAGGTAISGTAGNIASDSKLGRWVRNVDSVSATDSLLDASAYVDPDIDTVVVKSNGTIDDAATKTHIASIVTRFSKTNYRAFLPHISEGIDAKARAEFDEANALGAIVEKTAIVHCAGCSTAQFAQMAKAKANLIWSPQSNLDLYGQTANVTTAKRLGVTIALGVDWTPSGSMNQLGELQCARKISDTYLDHAFTDPELVAMATSNPAAVMHLDDQIGKIAVGLYADLTVIGGDRTKPYRALLEAKSEQVKLVTIKGKAVYGDTALLTGTITGGATCTKVPDGLSPDGKPGVCGVDKTFCADATDATLATQIKAILDMTKAADTACNSSTPTGSYCYGYQLFPLFRCGALIDDDRCKMGHPAITKYPATDGTIPAVSGVPVPGTDDDGDGVPNASDNCPKIFNPPFDTATMQDDADGDGIGDVCDPTPCTKADGSDACPTTTPPTATATVLTIPEIRDPSSAKRPKIGDLVEVDNVVVTAVKASSTTSKALVIQDPTATQWAGLYVFVGSTAPTVAVGDQVTVKGSFDVFHALEQVNVSGGSVTKTGTATVPAAIVVLPADITTGGSKAKLLQSMLVTVTGVTAKTATTTVSGSNVFTLDPSGLAVTDYILGPATMTAAAGDTFTSITGVVYAFAATTTGDDSRLAPRISTDIAK